MGISLNPELIKNRWALGAVLLIVFESLFLLWFSNAEDPNERIIAGVIAAVVLIVFLLKILSKENAQISPHAEKLVGKWTLTSISSSGTEGHGTLSIAKSKNQIAISGVLHEGGKQVGTFNSEVTRVNENRIIFYYVLRDSSKNENMDAVSILVFDPNDPNELHGDWIVASKTPRHGSVKYVREST